MSDGDDILALPDRRCLTRAQAADYLGIGVTLLEPFKEANRQVENISASLFDGRICFLAHAAEARFQLIREKHRLDRVIGMFVLILSRGYFGRFVVRMET